MSMFADDAKLQKSEKMGKMYNMFKGGLDTVWE